MSAFRTDRRIYAGKCSAGDDSFTIAFYCPSLLKKRAATLWLLTFREESTLTREIGNNLILNLKHEGDPWDIVPNNSTTVNLIVLQGLAMHIAERRGVTLQDFKKNHPGGHIGEQLKNA